MNISFNLMKYFEMIRILELKYFDLFFKILVIVIF